MKLGALAVVGAAAYEKEWAEFQAVQGQRNGVIPQAFKDNLDLIKAHNAEASTYTLSYTGPFADKTSAEYKQVLGYKPRSLYGDLPKVSDRSLEAQVAPSIDWVTKGAVTAVKDQAHCGSCWAFSTTGSLEGAWQVASGNLIPLSEQQLVDCSKNGGDNGCSGGLMENGFEYLKDVNVCTEASYPYTGAEGTCDPSGCTAAIPRNAVTGYVDAVGEAGLLTALQKTTVSVAIEADQFPFSVYSSGILSGTCGTNLDHGVLVVGYGAEGGMDYWKVKNSWGNTWGESGYLRIERGVNKCGIGTQPTYPLVDSSVPPSPPAPTPPTPAPTPPTTTAQPPVSDTCEFPEVQDCYTRAIDACWEPMLAKDKLTKAALDALPDANVAAGIAKLLLDGSEFKEIWEVTKDQDSVHVHLTAYKFEAISFNADYQFAMATLQLSAGSDASYLEAYNKFTDQFDGHFYQACVTPPAGRSMVV